MKHGASDSGQTTARQPLHNPAWFGFWAEAFRLHALLLERRAAKHQADDHPQDGTRP